jgi:hypothetical protein
VSDLTLEQRHEQLLAKVVALDERVGHLDKEPMQSIADLFQIVAWSAETKTPTVRVKEVMDRLQAAIATFESQKPR